MGPIHKKTHKGMETAPKIVSAKAVFITSKRLFSDAKTTNVRKFPTVIIQLPGGKRCTAPYTYIPSTCEWYEEDMLFAIVVSDTLFLFLAGGGGGV